MLIVTNGDMAADRIRGLGLDAEILPWRDVLHDGPVEAAENLGAVSAARAAFLAEMSGRSEADEVAALAARDAAFEAAAAAGRRIELWFEHDLYDQLQLAQILWAAPAGADLHLIQTDDHLTALDDKDFAALAGTAQSVNASMRAEALAAWTALTAADPSDLDRMANGPVGALPHMAPALKRLVAEYPDARTGLPATLAMALSFLMALPATVAELFKQTQDAEDAAFMGDLSFARLIDDVALCQRPLIAGPDGTPLAPVMGGGREAFGQQTTLTPFGVSVLIGAADHVAENGIDRWIGGVHLTAERCYRRSAETGGLLALDDALPSGG